MRFLSRRSSALFLAATAALTVIGLRETGLLSPGPSIPPSGGQVRAGALPPLPRGDRTILVKMSPFRQFSEPGSRSNGAAIPDPAEGPAGLGKKDVAQPTFDLVLARLIAIFPDAFAGLDPSLTAAEKARLVIRQWGESDPAAVVAWVSALPAGALRDDLLQQAALGWSDNDLSAALDWARQSPDPGTRGKLLTTLGTELARTNPIDALDLATAMSPGLGRDALIQFAANQWAAQDPKAAADWASQVGDGKLKENLLQSIVSVWSASQPAAAAQFTSTSMPSEDQPQLGAVITQQWALRDAPAAAAWVSQAAAGPVRDAMTGSLLSTWSAQDPAAAAAWAGSLQDASWRDQSLSLLAQDLAERKSGSAQSLAQAQP